MFTGHYDAWRDARIRCIKKYIDDDFFKNKTMLELGCGYADNGHILSQMGASVTASDARKEHLDIVNTKYPHIKTVLQDLDNDNIEDFYDIILHWSILCHIKEIENHLEKVFNKCNVLFLETEILDSIDKDYVLTNENGYDQAFNNTGIRPSQLYLERLIKKHKFNFIMIKDPILNSGIHHYDWEIKNTNIWRDGQRRFWICWKDTFCPLKNEIVEKKQKIAMYFPGRITAYENCIQNILKLKDKYDITFFCSLNLSELTDYEQEFFRLLHMGPEQYAFEKVITPDYIYKLDTQGKLDSRGNPLIHNNVYSHFYNNKKCFNLISDYELNNNIVFDIIIKYRPDISSNRELQIILNCDKNTVYIPNGSDWFGINDQIAYGDHETMEIYSTLVDRISKYCQNENTAYHPESLTLKNLTANSITIQRFNFDYTLDSSRLR